MNSKELFDFSKDENVLFVAIFNEVLFQKFPINFTNIQESDIFIGTPYNSKYSVNRSNTSTHTFETVNPIKLNEKRRDINCASYANFMFESDSESLDRQFKKLDELIDERVITRAVFSGHKSIHVRLTLQNPPQNKEDYRFVWELLRDRYFPDISIDNQTKNPARLTRAPEQYRKDTSKIQHLLYLSTGPIYFNWEEKKEHEMILRFQQKIKTIQTQTCRQIMNKIKQSDHNMIFSKENQEAACFFENGKRDDNCKHNYLPKAVKFWRANPHKYERSDVERILAAYIDMENGNFYRWGMRMYDHQN